MILRVLSGGRELLIDNKRRLMKYYGRARDFRAPSSDMSVLSGGVVPSPEEKKRDAFVFLSWDEFVRRL